MARQAASGARTGAAVVLIVVALANLAYGLFRALNGQAANLPLFTIGLLGAGLAVVLLASRPRRAEDTDR